MNLESTVEFMISEDYKDRFIAEYWQTKIRHDKLKDYIQNIEIAQDYYDGHGEPKHDCPVGLLREQLYAMEEYLDVLDKRRKIEEIEF